MRNLKLVVIGAGLMLNLSACSSRVIVSVSNQSGVEIGAIRVDAPPSHMEFGSLKQGEQNHASFVPSQDTSLSIEFFDPSGQHLSSRVNTYYTPGYCGNTNIVIQPGFKVSHTENIDIYPCWHSPLTLLGIY